MGVLGAIVAGAIQGSLGTLIVKTTFSMQEYNPDLLMSEGLVWAILITAFGLVNHMFDSAGKISFSIAGEHLTRRLRLLALQQLLHQEIGYFDEPQNSVGQLTEFLGEKVSLVQGLATEQTGM
eukprot:1997170-Prymnesium_polylepis.1